VPFFAQRLALCNNVVVREVRYCQMCCNSSASRRGWHRAPPENRYISAYVISYLLISRKNIFQSQKLLLHEASSSSLIRFGFFVCFEGYSPFPQEKSTKKSVAKVPILVQITF
jgi:hypothetical protein